jgi:hypothetical protein
MLILTAAPRINYVAATMAKTRTKEDDIYVERVPIPLDQRTIAALAWLERTTGEPAAQIAGRFLADLCAQFGKVKGATLQ